MSALSLPGRGVRPAGRAQMLAQPCSRPFGRTIRQDEPAGQPFTPPAEVADLRPPDNRTFAVVGFDNRIEIAAHMRPPLTTVALPYYEMGSRAIDVVLSADPDPGLTLVTCPLITRASILTDHGSSQTQAGSWPAR